MKSIALALLPALLAIAGPTGAQSPFIAWEQQLPPGIRVSALLQDSQGEVLYELDPLRQVPSASVIKTHLLTAFFQEADAGRIKLKKAYTLRQEDIVGGSGTLQNMAPGSKISYYELAEKMMVASDNVATNILIEAIGMEELNQRFAAWGMGTTRLARKMMDFEAVQQGRQNYICAQDANRMLLLLQQGEILSRKSRKTAIKILLRCEDASAIPAKLPPKVRVAHKTGTLDYVRGDAGIILARQPLTLSVFVEGFQTLEQANAIIAELAELAYQHFGAGK